MARILVADDDSSSLDVLTLALGAEGHEVLCASNGLEAYEMTASDKPDLVFLDVMMPVHNGYETCHLIRNDSTIPPELPVVFLTSMDKDDDKMRQVGASGHLPKRHVVSDLRDCLIKHLGPDAIGDLPG